MKRPGLDPQMRRALRLAWWRHRRAALLLGTVLAVLVGYRIAAPGGPDLVPVPVADRDLAAGSVLAAGDVRTVSWPRSSVPSGLLPSPAGRTVAGPLRAGEAITDTRVVGSSLLAGQPAGTVAVAVRPADPSSASIVRPGDRVDVLAAGSGSAAGTAYGSSPVVAQRVASSALVLSSPGAGDGTSSGSTGGTGLLGGGSGGSVSGSSAGGGSAAAVLVLAVDQLAAARLAAAQGGQLLSVVLLAGTTTLGPDPAG